MSEPRKFRPKRLRAESVQAPLRPEWKVMGEQEAHRLHEQAVADHRRFQWFGPRMRRRLLRYVVGTAVGFAVIGWLFVTGDVATFVTFFLVGIPLGAVVAVMRPLDFTAGALYALAALVAMFLTHRHLLLAALAALLFGSLGIAIGRGEEMKRLDLED